MRHPRRVKRVSSRGLTVLIEVKAAEWIGGEGRDQAFGSFQTFHPFLFKPYCVHRMREHDDSDRCRVNPAVAPHLINNQFGRISFIFSSGCPDGDAKRNEGPIHLDEIDEITNFLATGGSQHFIGCNVSVVPPAPRKLGKRLVPQSRTQPHSRHLATLSRPALHSRSPLRKYHGRDRYLWNISKSFPRDE